MSQRHFPDWLKAFVQHASFGEAPLKMLFWTGVSTVAGALQRRVWIDQKYFQWIPNFYVILVAPPGIVSKSTTANIGMNLLRGVEGIIFGPDVITWQEMIAALERASQATAAPNGDLYPMSAVTFCSDELGNLLAPKDQNLVDALVALWDGKQGVFKKATKTQGSNAIENPFVNIIGCTTPSWISGNFPEYMIGGGFTSRCVFIYAERKRQFVPYVDEVVPKDFHENAKRLIDDLRIISEMFGEFRLTADARVWGRAWYARHWKNPPPTLTGDQFAGYLARKQTHVHKLAMVLSASESDSMTITHEHLELAESMASAIEADMPKVFSRIGQSGITRGSFEIIQLVESYPGITHAALFKLLFRTLSYREFSEAINGALSSRQILMHQSGTEQQYFPFKATGDERKSDQVSSG